MAFQHAYIPFTHLWTTPFTKWQGPLAEVNALDLAVDTTGRALAARDSAPEMFTHWALGMTVIQQGAFYGVTSISRRLGAGAEPEGGAGEAGGSGDHCRFEETL